jgi:hypothetical protein
MNRKTKEGNVDNGFCADIPSWEKGRLVTMSDNKVSSKSAGGTCTRRSHDANELLNLLQEADFYVH